MTSKTEARHRKRKCGTRSKPAKASSDPPNLFTIFNELPKEIRLMIWEAALPGPRIVHVTQARLKSSRFGRWRVRSDRLVEDKCFETERDREDDYLWIAERHQRVKDRMELLSRDDEDSGWDTDDDRLCEAYPGRPRSCWGYRTHCPNPAMLLACRESHDVASKVYTPIFGSVSTRPSIWFNLQQDTLYLHEKYFTKAYHRHAEDAFLDDALEDFPLGDITRIQNLAIYARELIGFDEEYEAWLTGILGTFENVKKFTVVNEHYKTPRRHRNEEEALGLPKHSNLAFSDLIDIGPTLEMYERPGDYGWLREEDIPRYVKPFYQMTDINMELLEDHRKNWIETGFGSWEMPRIEEKIIMTSFMKEMLEEQRAKFVDVVCKEPRYHFRHPLPRRQKISKQPEVNW